MAIDTIEMVYIPVYDELARPIIVTPVASQPSAPAYTNRGIPGTEPIDVNAMDGSIVSDQRTIIDIIETEFAVLPKQLDRINVPAYGSIPAMGDFEVMDLSSNGGGETTLQVRKLVTAEP